MKHFVQNELMEGYIVQVRGLKSRWSKAIIRVLGSWASHDAIVVRENGVLAIGDVQPIRARVTSLADYEKAVAKGEIEIRVLSPRNYSHYDGMCAAHWWVTNEVGKIYNFAALPLLLVKALFGDWFQWSRDLYWDWCTEGIMDAWLGGAKQDYWRKDGDTTRILRPTPLTTQHRLEEGVFVDVTEKTFK